MLEPAPEAFGGHYLLAKALLAAGGASPEVRRLAHRAAKLAPDSPAAQALLAEVEPPSR